MVHEQIEMMDGKMDGKMMVKMNDGMMRKMMLIW